MIKKHLFDNDSSDLRSTHLGYNGEGTVTLSLGFATDEAQKATPEHWLEKE